MAPWVFLGVFIWDKRRAERMWRENLVYLKSSSAYEAEDNIKRMNEREKGMIQKGLANIAKRGENLTDEPRMDLAMDMRETLQKKYETP